VKVKVTNEIIIRNMNRRKRIPAAAVITVRRHFGFA
jgi:hypothetical protein